MECASSEQNEMPAAPMNSPADPKTHDSAAFARCAAGVLAWLRREVPTAVALAEWTWSGLVDMARSSWCTLCLLPYALASVAIPLWRRVWASPVTLVIAAVNLVLFRILEATGGNDAYWSATAVTFRSFQEGEWWRVLSSAWAHSDWDHVYGNCLYLIPFGLLLEPAMGSRAFGFLYFASAIGSGVGCSLFQVGSCAGASGAITGLNGALLAYPVCASRDARRCVWVSAFYWGCLDLGRHDEVRLAYAGHLGGLLTGYLVASFFRRRSDAPAFAPRRARLAIATLATAGIVVLLAADPRWSLTLKAQRADRQARAGLMQEAECTWGEIERMADPERPVEASLLADAADFHAQRGDHMRARALLERVAPTLQDAGIYMQLGALKAYASPVDDSGADLSLSSAYSINPASSATLHELAWIALWTSDPTLFHPEKALGCAAAAVELESSPEALLVLGWAQFACGRRAEAVQSLRRAIDLDPTDPWDCTSALIKMARPCAPWKSIAERDRWYDADF